jgi:hypothetical protein
LQHCLNYLKVKMIAESQLDEIGDADVRAVVEAQGRQIAS